jgi:hypothetical protein
MIHLAAIELPMTARNYIRRMLAAALLAAALAGCAGTGGIGDDSMARFLVASDRFVLFNCEQLATRTTAIVTRQKELEALMAKAGPGADGQLASMITYKPEYVELRGDMIELRKTAAARNCKPMPALDEGRSSDRAVR